MSLISLILALASVVLLLAMVAIWQSVRIAFARPESNPYGSVDTTTDGDAALLDEKRALLTALRDLEFEREVGKISQEDFEGANASYRARAKDVLAALDKDLEPYQDDARALIEAAIRNKPA